MEDRPEQQAMIVAVPADALAELVSEGLGRPLPVLRGGVLDAMVTVGMDSAALVTLLQAPDSIRVFAAWVHGRCTRSGQTIELSARRGNQRIHLTVDGDINVSAVADFLNAAFTDENQQA